MGYGGNGKNRAPTVFNRSISVHPKASAAVPDVSDKPSHNIYSSYSMFQRNGSVKHPQASSVGNSFHGKVKKLCSIFELPKKNQFSESPNSSSLPSSPSSASPKYLRSPADSGNSSPKRVFESRIKLPGTEDRVVIYFTSLRGIRRTFQDCHSVRMIFLGFRVKMDERDVSMDADFRKELPQVLKQKNVTLPQVFIKGKYIGGAEMIKQLLEVGDLAKLLKGLPSRQMKPCDACDDARFIPCTNCSGSRKVFDEEEEKQRRCPECNENGLLRCPLCCFL